MPGQQRIHIVGIEPERHRHGFDMGVERVQVAGGALRLHLAGIGGFEQHLALQVGQRDGVVIDDGQPAHARRREIEQARAAQPAGADNGDPRPCQRRLSAPAKFRKHQVTGVAFKLVVGKVHPCTPVEPKPPAPRCVSSSVSTTASVARVTAAGTNWQIRMPRSMAKGSWPKLISSAFTSPR